MVWILMNYCRHFTCYKAKKNVKCKLNVENRKKVLFQKFPILSCMSCRLYITNWKSQALNYFATDFVFASPFSQGAKYTLCSLPDQKFLAHRTHSCNHTSKLWTKLSFLTKQCIFERFQKNLMYKTIHQR